MTDIPRGEWAERMRQMREKLGRPLTLDELMGASEAYKSKKPVGAPKTRPLPEIVKDMYKHGK